MKAGGTTEKSLSYNNDVLGRGSLGSYRHRQKVPDSCFIY